MKDQSKIILQIIFHIDGDFNNSRKLKKYHSRLKLQIDDLNLVLRKTATTR